MIGVLLALCHYYFCIRVNSESAAALVMKSLAAAVGQIAFIAQL